MPLLLPIDLKWEKKPRRSTIPCLPCLLILPVVPEAPLHPANKPEKVWDIYCVRQVFVLESNIDVFLQEAQLFRQVHGSPCSHEVPEGTQEKKKSII